MATTPGRASGACKYASLTASVSPTLDPSTVPGNAAHKIATALDDASPPLTFRGAGYAQDRQRPGNADAEREELKIYIGSMRTRELKVELKKSYNKGHTRSHTTKECRGSFDEYSQTTPPALGSVAIGRPGPDCPSVTSIVVL